MIALTVPSRTRMFASVYLPKSGKVGSWKGRPGVVVSVRGVGIVGPVSSPVTRQSCGSIALISGEMGSPLLTNPVVTWLAIPFGTAWYSGLLDLAARGRLRKPGVLQHQVHRMLADRRSRALVTNFAGQWLYLRNLRLVSPDPYVFPD